SNKSANGLALCKTMAMLMSDWPLFQRADLNAVMVEFEPRVDIQINHAVQRLAAYLNSEQPPWLLEVVPSYRNVMVYYDFQLIEFANVCDILQQACQASQQLDMAANVTTHEVPVCY